MFLPRSFCSYIYFSAIHKIPVRVFQRECRLHILPTLHFQWNIKFYKYYMYNVSYLSSTNKQTLLLHLCENSSAIIDPSVQHQAIQGNCAVNSCTPVQWWSAKAWHSYLNRSTPDMPTPDRSSKICLTPTWQPKYIYCWPVYSRPVQLNMSTANMSASCPHVHLNSIYPWPVYRLPVHWNMSTADLSVWMHLLQICLPPTCSPEWVSYCRSVCRLPVLLNMSNAGLSI